MNRDSLAVPVNPDNWVTSLAERFQRLLAGPDGTNEQRIRAMMAANGISRSATLLTEIPYDELRDTTIGVATQVLGIDNSG